MFFYSHAKKTATRPTYDWGQLRVQCAMAGPFGRLADSFANTFSWGCPTLVAFFATGWDSHHRQRHSHSFPSKGGCGAFDLGVPQRFERRD